MIVSIGKYLLLYKMSPVEKNNDSLQSMVTGAEKNSLNAEAFTAKRSATCCPSISITENFSPLFILKACPVCLSIINSRILFSLLVIISVIQLCCLDVRPNHFSMDINTLQLAPLLNIFDKKVLTLVKLTHHLL